MAPAPFRRVIAASPGLRLEAVEEGQAAELFALVDAGRPYLKRWLPWVEGTRSAADTAAFIKRAEEEFSRREALHYALRAEGRLCGVIGCHKIDWPNASTTVGYWLAQDRQGRGLMTQAARGLLDYAFRGLGLRRASVHCASANRKSRALPERLGFTESGVVKGLGYASGGGADEVVYFMTAERWRSRQWDE